MAAQNVAPEPAAAPLRWDLLREHLDEAGFLWEQREQALTDPEYTIDEVDEGPEERLRAHVDALVIAGRRAAEKLLVPALTDEEPGVAPAAATALLASEDGDFAAPVITALVEADEETAPPLVRALQRCERADLLAKLMPLLANPSTLLQACAVDILALQRIDAKARLDGLLAARDPRLVEAALRYARWFPERAGLQAVERALMAEERAVRDAAIETGLVLGSKAAWARCEALVREGGPDRALAANLWALSGEPDLQPLLARLDDDEARAEAIFALGFSGRAAVVDRLLPLLEDEDVGPLAAEAIGGITGLRIEGKFATDAPGWDPDAPEEEEPAPSALPLPEPAAIRAWWTQARKGFEGDRRFLAGRPWTGEALASTFETASLRRRAVLAKDLAIRSRGLALLDPADDARHQRQDWARVRSAVTQASANTYRAIIQYPAAQRPPVPPRVAAPPAAR